MKDLRVKAPLIMSFCLLVMAYGLGAQATTAITRAEMESFVYGIIAAAGAAVIGSFWLLLRYVTDKTETSLGHSIGRLERTVENLAELMVAHHDDPLAHPKGSANRIDPINTKLDDMNHKLTTLLAEHRVIRSTEDQVCELIRLRSADKQRRDSDPQSFDSSALRSDS